MVPDKPQYSRERSPPAGPKVTSKREWWTPEKEKPANKPIALEPRNVLPGPGRDGWIRPPTFR